MKYKTLKVFDSLLYFTIIITLIAFFIGIITLLAAIFPIHADLYYGWTGGLWHGFISIGNWILSLFQDGRLLSAPLHSTPSGKWYQNPFSYCNCYSLMFWLTRIAYFLEGGFFVIVGIVFSFKKELFVLTVSGQE